MTKRDAWLVAIVAFTAIVIAILSIASSAESFKSDPSLSSAIAQIRRFEAFELCRILAVVTGIVSVYFASRESIWVWPVGIVWCLSTAWVMYAWRFYGDMALMFVYLGLQLHGWWSWKHGGHERSELPIRRASWKTLATLVVIVAIAIWPASQFLALEWVHGKAPFWDSFTTVGSLGAQFLLNRKYIENWIGWIIVDLIYVPVYLYFGLPDQAVLYACFLVLAFAGLAQWVRLYRSQICT